jgi:hypothetical protein
MPPNKLNDTISVDEVRRLFSYDPAEGVLRHKCEYSRDTGQRGRPRKIGSLAGYYDKSTGYRKVEINDHSYAVHRLIHLYVTGEWPEYEIDHIDMNRENNKWENLRPATSYENQRNRTVYVNSRSQLKSQLKGIYYSQDNGKWGAKIRVNGKVIYLGQFDTGGEAYEVYKSAIARLHGEFARHQ